MYIHNVYIFAHICKQVYIEREGVNVDLHFFNYLNCFLAQVMRFHVKIWIFLKTGISRNFVPNSKHYSISVFLHGNS